MTHTYPQNALDTLNLALAQIIDPADSLISDLKVEMQGKGETPTQIGVLAETDAYGLATIAKADLVRKAYSALPLEVVELDDDAFDALEELFTYGRDVELNPLKEAYRQIQMSFKSEIEATVQEFYNSAVRKEA